MSINVKNAIYYLKKSDQLEMLISQWSANIVKVLKLKEKYRIFSLKGPILSAPAGNRRVVLALGETVLLAINLLIRRK